MLPRYALAPLPLFILQPLLQRMVERVAERHPELFDRLGVHSHKVFLVDPVNLPFALELRPAKERPELRALRRSEIGGYDARISGTLLTLLGVADGTLDGDALFFSRELEVSGDTEASVSLRNAMDDTDGTLADDVAGILGPPGQLILAGLRRLRSRNEPS
jgi:predicted lipid carrier protein YhbT